MFEDVDPERRLTVAFLLTLVILTGLASAAGRYFDLQEKALDARIAEQLEERGLACD